MAIIVREADLVQDQDLLISTLNQNRLRSTDERRYRWLYLDNPFGQARAWIAVDGQNGAVAGFTSVFPRLMEVCGTQTICWNCGDFSINQRYRSLGVAIQLRLAATRLVNKGDVAFLYAHPNDRMKVVHLRAGHKVIGQMVRYAKLLRIDRYLPKLPGRSWIASALASTFSALHSLGTHSRRLKRSFTAEAFDGFATDAPFNSLLAQAQGRWRIFGLRTNEYLKWRFGSNPLFRVHTLLLYRAAELVGYAFYSLKDDTMHVNDMFCLPEQETADALITGLTNTGWNRGAQALSVTLLESNPLVQSLVRNGYRRRAESSSVIVHAAPELPWGPVLQDKTNWFMTVGDRDV
jgi:hypothetical protein